MILKKKVTKAIDISRAYLLGYGKINKKKKGIINLIDVGSASGDLPTPWYEKSGFIKKLLCFDPQEGNKTEKNVITIGKGLWKTETTVPLYHCAHPSGASLFKQNLEYVDANFDWLKQKGPSDYANTWHQRSKQKGQENVEVTTLDKVFSRLNLDFSFDFLKIDAQGAEYEILLGGENFIKNSCLGLHLELFNVPLYKGIKLEPEVTKYLAGFGFSLVKKFPFHGTFNSQNDCLYLKLEDCGGNKEKLALIKQIYEID